MALAAWQGFITDGAGNTVSADVTVYEAGTLAKPTIYSEDSGTTTKSNPFNVPAGDRAFFYVAAGRYDIEIDKGSSTVTLEDVPIGNAQSLDLVDILKAVYPVGSLYCNASDGTDPNTLLGFGTWELTAKGRGIVGDDDGVGDYNAGDTGGAEEHQHKAPVALDGGTGGSGMRVGDDTTGNNSNLWGSESGPSVNVKADEVNNTTTGSEWALTDARSSWPPYEVFYIWKRTA